MKEGKNWGKIAGLVFGITSKELGIAPATLQSALCGKRKENIMSRTPQIVLIAEEQILTAGAARCRCATS